LEDFPLAETSLNHFYSLIRRNHVKDNKRAERRLVRSRRVQRTEDILKHQSDTPEETIPGKARRMCDHMKQSSSCICCMNPRRVKGGKPDQLTFQERHALTNFSESDDIDDLEDLTPEERAIAEEEARLDAENRAVLDEIDERNQAEADAEFMRDLDMMQAMDEQARREEEDQYRRMGLSLDDDFPYPDFDPQHEWDEWQNRPEEEKAPRQTSHSSTGACTTTFGDILKSRMKDMLD
jgi:hypothetical protein